MKKCKSCGRETICLFVDVDTGAREHACGYCLLGIDLAVWGFAEAQTRFHDRVIVDVIARRFDEDFNAFRFLVRRKKDMKRQQA